MMCVDRKRVKGWMERASGDGSGSVFALLLLSLTRREGKEGAKIEGENRATLLSVCVFAVCECVSRSASLFWTCVTHLL